jgi:hypothetical protein
MGLKFASVFENVSISAIQDAFSLKAGASNPIKLVKIEIAQNGNSDVGDAQEEDLRWQIKVGATTQGSGGSAPTPSNGRGNTATATAHANDTTQASAGTSKTCYASAFNIRTGLLYIPTPEEAELTVTPAGQIMQIAFPAAPADAVTFTGTIIHEELGT